MGDWHVRSFEEPDLDRAVRLWERNADEVMPIFPLASVVEAVRVGDAALVAEHGDEVVGAAVAEVDGDDAWLLRLTVLPAWRGRGIGGALLDALGSRLEAAGVRRFIALAAAGETAAGSADQTFLSRGFDRRDEVTYFERRLGRRDDPVDERLRQLGGLRIEPGLWSRLAGMTREKALVERRVILPLAKPDLAARHGVEPPKAIVLFGPPGTGKTTFAKGVASRLDWPFVELFPSALAGGPDGQLGALREFFLRVDDLEEVVLFIDEVEDLAARRDGRPVSHAMTNELLKAIPRFRAAPRHLLVCATNSVRSLDGAFIRAGRFDYLLPVGPPDPEARLAIWSSYAERITDQPLDLDRLVEASELFTPADIDFAARKAAQASFERAVFERNGTRATMEDFLAAVAATRPSLDRATIRAFEEDIEDYARV